MDYGHQKLGIAASLKHQPQCGPVELRCPYTRSGFAVVLNPGPVGIGRSRVVGRVPLAAIIVDTDRRRMEKVSVHDVPVAVFGER